MYLINDLKYAWRLLLKQPFFSLLAIIVLAGGLAVSLYTFSLLQTAVYKDLPLADGQDVVTIRADSESGNQLFTFEVQRLREQLNSLSEIGVFKTSSMTFKDDNVSVSLVATQAEWNIFEFARTEPLMGRGLLPSDAEDGTEPVVVIGYGFWRSQFGGNNNILDRTININGEIRKVVGVMPEGFAFPVRSQMWFPLAKSDLSAPAYAPSGGLPHMVSVYGRLADGSSLANVQQEFDGLLFQLREEFSRPSSESYRYPGVEVTTFQKANFGEGGLVLFTVLNAISLAILILACANVGNMLLARTNERAKEVAVRVALGAPRWRLIAQMSLESFIICVIAGGLALMLAAWWLAATNTQLHSLEPGLPFWMNWGLDGSTVLSLVIFVILAVFLVAALPIFSITNIEGATLLRSGTRGSQSRGSGKLTRFLVTLQIVLIALVMVVGGALSVIAKRFVEVDFGIEQERLLFVESYGPDTAFEPGKLEENLRAFESQLLAALRSEPSIEAAMQWTPVSDAHFAIDSSEYQSVYDYPEATIIVSSDATEQLGAKLSEGRYFDHRESVSNARSAMVTETLAQTYWPGESAVGRSIQFLNESGVRSQPYTVVGVVKDVLDPARVLQVNERAYISIVLPLNKEMFKFPGEFLVRHTGNEEEARAGIMSAIERLGGVPGRPVVPYADELERAMRLARAMTETIEEAALFAILLGLTGIYGLCRNEVIRRTQEIGLRRAIGATEITISMLLLKQSVKRLLVGLLIGAGLSAFALFSLLKFADLGLITILFIGAAVILTISLLVTVSSYISTRSVLKAEPAEALRYE